MPDSLEGAVPEALNRAVAARAAAEGLLDVAYCRHETPLGRLLLAGTPEGVVRIAFEGEDPDRLLDDLALRLSPRVVEAPGRLDAVRRELDEYFAGRRTRFDVAIDWSLTSGFRRRVLEATARIPFGHVGTYQGVAAEAGNPAASRAAGGALGSNPVPVIVPCHRVLRTGGALGGYGGGLDKKEFLLRLEGAPFTTAG